MKKLRGKQRDREIIRAIKLTYESLDSHLSYIYGPQHRFHRKCTREYADILKALCDSL